MLPRCQRRRRPRVPVLTDPRRAGRRNAEAPKHRQFERIRGKKWRFFVHPRERLFTGDHDGKLLVRVSEEPA